jgi:hypothetical protein
MVAGMFHVQKVPVPVVLTLHGGGTLKGAIHVLPLLADGRGAERVVDLLLGPERFLPLTAGAGVTFVLKEHIVSVQLGDARHAGVDPDEPAREEPVRLKLSGARNALRGLLRLTAGPSGSRLMDHLNGAGAFLVLRAGDAWMLVATRAIITASPAPAVAPRRAARKPARRTRR